MNEQTAAPGPRRGPRAYDPNKYKTVLLIAPGLRFMSTNPLPNAWRRFWLRLLLGWEWRAVKQEQTNQDRNS